MFTGTLNSNRGINMSKECMGGRICWQTARMLVAVAVMGGAAHAGTNTLPSQWSYEGIAPGTFVVSSAGVGAFGWEGTAFSSSNHAAEVVALTPTVPANGYPLPSESHDNSMQVLGDVKVAFDTVQTAGNTNVYIDTMVQAGRLSFSPDAPEGAQVAAYFNSNGLLVVRHTVYTNILFPKQDFVPSRNWTELSHTPVDSNAWVRLTITLDYYGAGPTIAEKEHFFTIALNGTRLESPLAYTDVIIEQSESSFPRQANPGETNVWFMCADSGFGDGVPNNQFFTSLEFSGAGNVDDVHIRATDTPPPPCTPGFGCWIESFYPACPSCRSEGDDPDDDGVSNWEEYLAGTNPSDPDSSFRVVREQYFHTPANSNLVVWLGSTNSGNFSMFTIHRSTNLLSNTYWVPVASNLMRSPTGTNMWYDTNPPAGRAYYRPSLPTNAP